jgi:hypothetical protein
MAKPVGGVYPPHGTAAADGAFMSHDRLLQVLLYLTILLFVGAGVLPLARSRYPVAKWARWAAIAVFAAAVLYALALTFGWALGH